jgi:hypothetical protein
MAHRGGETVSAGFYWRGAAWEIVPVSGPGGALPGDGGERYLRIPTFAMLLAAPVMGALLVVFLPFIGFALLGGHLFRRGARAGHRLIARLAAGLHRENHASR